MDLLNFSFLGLDPANPLFCFPFTQKIEKRLDKSDAKYVQVIITSKGSAGCALSCGHQNFLPNGGEAPQPGCPLTLGIVESFSCSHGLATEYFRLSLNPAIKYKSKLCTSWDTYKAGTCSQFPMDIMGYRSARLKGDFYLKVSEFPPYI